MLRGGTLALLSKAHYKACLMMKGLLLTPLDEDFHNALCKALLVRDRMPSTACGFFQYYCILF